MKQKSLLKTMLLLCALIAGSSSVWATNVPYLSLTFPDDNSANNGLTSNQYSSTWTAKSGSFEWSITNFNNNNWNNSWTYIKCGSKSAASTATITTKSAIDAKIFKVVVSVDATKNSTSSKLEVASDAAFTENLQTINATLEARDVTYNIPEPAANRYYRLTFEQAKGSNGDTWISKVAYCLSSEADAPIDGKLVATMSIASCTYASKTWTNTVNSAYTLSQGGGADIASKAYGDDTLIKIPGSSTMTVTIPDGVTITKVAISGKSNSTDGTTITVGETGVLIRNAIKTAIFDIASPADGADITFTTSNKEFGLEKIELYTADGITITTTANMAGWRAFYDASQDYTLDANTKAYVVSAKSGTQDVVELTELDVTAIPHGEPVILKTSAADHKMVLTKTTGVASLGTNLLDKTDGTHSYDAYRLGYGSVGVGFYKYTATKPAAGIVYLDPEYMNLSAGAPALSFVIAGGNTTAIKNVDAEKTTAPRKVMKDGRIVIETAEGLFSVSGARVK